jgi:hypothetical protein
LKVVRLDPKEVEYCSTLEWEELMIYLEKKYGIEFKDQFTKQIMEKVQKNFDSTDKKWRN